jgi:hypothetical protein
VKQQVPAFRRASLLGYSELRTFGISAHLFCCMHRIAVLYTTSRRRAALAWVLLQDLHDLDVQVPWTVSDAWRSPIAGHEIKLIGHQAINVGLSAWWRGGAMAWWRDGMTAWRRDVVMS